VNVNFAEIRVINIESVIRHYGWEHRRQGNTLVLKKCPLPSHSSSDVYTFKASIVQNLWTCHSSSCRKGMGRKDGDVLDLVCKVDGIEPLEAAKKLAGWKGETMDAKITKGIFDAFVGENKPLAFDLKTNPEHLVIQDRGISVETAQSYGVGYYRSRQGTASMDDRIIFPLH
jgi:hypothetical protein